MVEKIYLIRHGESTSDVKEKYDGDYDDSLTKKGKQEAVEIAEKLLPESIQVIYSSAKIRARETAEIVGNHLKCKTIIAEKMNEQDIYGAYQELGISQPEEEYRKLGELLVNRDNTVEGVETYEHFKNRIVDSFLEMLKSDYQSIAIITHGGPIRCIFREVLKIKEPNEIANGAIIKLEKNESGYRIIKTNNN